MAIERNLVLIGEKGILNKDIRYLRSYFDLLYFHTHTLLYPEDLLYGTAGAYSTRYFAFLKLEIQYISTYWVWSCLLISNNQARMVKQLLLFHGC